ncbi:unnamed protein product [Heterobilharzia americana]|nr:unnamed protein product [Heterobilharzia americana]
MMTTIFLTMMVKRILQFRDLETYQSKPPHNHNGIVLTMLKIERIHQTYALVLSCSCDHMLVGDDERERRKNATDYSASYIGHCNSITDIKEANFFGSYGQYIVGGSDCGAFFIWDRNTTNIMRIMKADSSTVNCVQPHPSICLLATSGIDSVIKLWSPNCEEDHEQSRVIKDHVGAAERNQQRVTADPFEIMLVNMGYRIPGLDFDSNRSRRSRHWNREHALKEILRNETHSGSNHRITSSDDGTFNGEPIQNNMNLINNDTTSTGNQNQIHIPVEELTDLTDNQKHSVGISRCQGVSISNKLSHQSSSQTPEQKPSKTVNTTVDEIFFQPPTAASIFDSDSNSSECDSDSNDDTPTGNTTRRQRKTSRRLLSNVNRLRRRILTRRIPFRASFPNEEIATTSWLFDFELNSSDPQTTTSETVSVRNEEDESLRNISRDEDAYDSNIVSEFSCTVS